MRMKIGAELPTGYEVTHEELAQSVGALIAHALLPIFGEKIPSEMAKANVEGILTEFAYLFDEGEIELGGKTYRPRLAFVDESNKVLPGFAELENLHEMVTEPFDLPPEANISFEAPEFDDPL